MLLSLLSQEVLPLFKTWWFIAIYLTVIIALVFLIYRLLRYNAALKKCLEQERLERKKTEALNHPQHQDASKLTYFKKVIFNDLATRQSHRVMQDAVGFVDKKSNPSRSINFEFNDTTLKSADEIFLQKAFDLVKKNISNPDFSIESMGKELGVSRVHLYRKLKTLINQKPNEFVRTIRLKHAAYLILQNKLNISEVAYAAGFKSHQYFTYCFLNYFKKSPTEYSRQDKENIKLIDVA